MAPGAMPFNPGADHHLASGERMFRDALTVTVIMAIAILACPAYVLMVVGSRRAIHNHYGS